MTPFFLHHVEPTRLKELQSRLESLSKLSLEYMVLLVGSTMIATLGLFQNSPAVIIGAMIIAPLMRPLVGLSLSTLTADMLLLSRASVTLIVGTLCGVTISAILGFMLQSINLTPEILSRTRPTLLDLGVAVFAGAVGAYCQTNQKLAETLAGVAIAVALVPPLSVIGIGLSINSPAVWLGATLLYATNLIGITFSGALVFLVMGFTPLRQAKKGLAISAGLVCLLAIPLGLSMRELILENQLSETIKEILTEKTYTFRGITLVNVEVQRFQKPMRVIATVTDSDQKITSNQVKLVQDFLSKETGSPVNFLLRIIPTRELTAIEVTTESAGHQPFYGQTHPQLPTVDYRQVPTPPPSTYSEQHPPGSEMRDELAAPDSSPAAPQSPQTTGTATPDASQEHRLAHPEPGQPQAAPGASSSLQSTPSRSPDAYLPPAAAPSSLPETLPLSPSASPARPEISPVTPGRSPFTPINTLPAPATSPNSPATSPQAIPGTPLVTPTTQSAASVIPSAKQSTPPVRSSPSSVTSPTPPIAPPSTPVLRRTE